jgi:hypothetical protein
LTPRRLRLELAPSLPLAIAVLALHALAGACLVLVLPGAAGLGLAALVLALGGAWAWERALLRSTGAVRVLELAEQSEAQRRYVTRFLVILPAGRLMRRAIVVTPDMLDAESFRRLRIWALWGRLPAVVAKQLPVRP